MTKPLPYGCIKKQKEVPTLSHFNRILYRIDHNDSIGHLLTVDIKFHKINEKTLLFNEIYPPIFEKDKSINPFERSTVQIMRRAVKKDGKDEIESLPYNSKTHSTLKDKIFVTLYAEDIHFLVTKAGWLVTYIYAHCTFYQSKFKKDFVIMNQKSRQTASSKVEKDFYKLLNNSNIGIDCRNSIDNCSLELIHDGIDEICYMKRYANIITDQKYRDFFSFDFMKKDIENELEQKLKNLNKEDPAYEATLEYFERRKAEDLDAVDSSVKKMKVKKRKLESMEDKISRCADPRKTKMTIEFNESEACVKTVAAKKKNKVKSTTRFMSKKLLMFAKLSLKSFIYSMVEILSFPNEIVQKIYQKYQREKIICYYTLTKTNSTSLQFVIISDPSNSYPECDVRDILFEIFVKVEIYKRLDTSHPF